MRQKGLTIGNVSATVVLATVAGSLFVSRAMAIAILAAPASQTSPASRPSPATQPLATRPLVSHIRVKESKYDIGKVWAGDTITHTFELVNTADKPLAIRSVHTELRLHNGRQMG